MENDSVRTIGEETLVDVWVEGKMRSIVVPRAAIEALGNLSPGKVQLMSDEQRNAFVRDHLGLVVSAAAEQLRRSGQDDQFVTIGAPAPHASTDRRQGDRRKGERRKANQGPPPAGERRRS